MHSDSGAVTKAVKQTKTRRSACIAVLINKALQPLKWRSTLAGAIKQTVTGDWCRIYWIYSLRITSLCAVTNFLHQVLPYGGCMSGSMWVHGTVSVLPVCSQLYGSYVTGVEGVQLHCLQQRRYMSKYTRCVCMHVHRYICVFRSMHICGHTYLFIYVCLCVDTQCTYVYMLYAHICSYIYMYCIHYLHKIRMCICTYVYIVDLCTDTQIGTDVSIHMYL